MVVYLASPIASTKCQTSWSASQSKLSRNDFLRQVLTENKFDVYLPQEHQKDTGVDTLQEQLAVIKDCDFLVLVLSDTRGAYMEAGYAKACGKKIFAIEVEETRKYSDWFVAFVDGIAKTPEELIKLIKESS